MIRTLCFTFALAAMLSGCADSQPAEEDNTSSSETENDSPSPDQRPTVKLPDDLPEDIPIYPDARPTAAGSAEGGFRASPMTLLHIETPDDIEAVREFYATELGKHEWVLDENIPGENLFLGEKGERKIQIQIQQLQADPPKVDVSISFTRPKDGSTAEP